MLLDAPIAALRVGFLPPSHQLAGVNFFLRCQSSAAAAATQGSDPFIGIFVVVSFFLLVVVLCAASAGLTREVRGASEAPGRGEFCCLFKKKKKNQKSSALQSGDDFLPLNVFCLAGVLS